MRHLKPLLLLAGMAISSGPINAADNALKVTLTDGHSTTFLLSQRPTVVFDACKLIISSPDASAEFDRKEVADLTFTSTDTSAAEILETDFSISYQNGTVSAPGLQIAVFDLTGNKVMEGIENISIESLDSGIYIVKTQRHTLKIRK